MSNESDVALPSEVYQEILRDTDKKSRDVKERLLRKTMVELVKANRATFLFLRDDECRAWWDKIVKTAVDDLAIRKEEWRVYTIKQDVWERLSPEDRRLIGLRKPTPPKIPLS